MGMAWKITGPNGRDIANRNGIFLLDPDVSGSGQMRWSLSRLGNRRKTEPRCVGFQILTAGRDAKGAVIKKGGGAIWVCCITASQAGVSQDDFRELGNQAMLAVFDEYKAEFGRTVLCGYAWIGGHAVGIVANQKINQNQTVSMGPAAGMTQMEVGGVIYTEGAQKAARFIMDCNQNLVPLIFLHDVNGFMVGKEAEWSGIIRAGAKMVSAVSTSVVPKITVIVGGSFGAGHYAMCGKAYDPRFLFAWPTARYAVMSGASAAATLAEVRARQLERDGKKLDGGGEDRDRRRHSRHVRRTGRSTLRRGAALDRCHHRSGPNSTHIDPRTGGMRIEPDLPRFNPGVLQT